MRDNNDEYYELFTSMALVSAFFCTIALVCIGIGKLIGWML